MKLLIAFAVFGLVYTATAATVEPKIWEDLETSELITIFVTFKKADTKAAWDRFYSLRLTTREAILDTQHAILRDHAEQVQGDVIAMLKKLESTKKHYSEISWITNELIVRDIDRETIEILMNHPDVESLVADELFELEPLVEEETVQDENTIQNQWGVTNVGAPAVWSSGNQGQGIVAAVIDTGARHTHNLLSGTYRGNNAGENHNYNWRAPTGNAAVPSDTNGHGTHCTGTISGTGGIGVAPGSRWISCRGCAGSSCAQSDLISCGNWVACPTNTAGGAPQCNRAPNVVNNSWGGAGGRNFYDGVINAWRNAGIVPVFSIGNSGAACGTAGSPGDRTGSIGVGSITSTNAISGFSSRGPTTDGRIKPDISAPGSSVASASHLNDTGLRTLSGTSMAAPHVAGVACLVLSRRPGLTVAQVTTALTSGAVAHAAGTQNCGARPENVRPNNTIGAGRVSAPNSA